MRRLIKLKSCGRGPTRGSQLHIQEYDSNKCKTQNNPLQQIKQLISPCNDSSAPYTNFRPAWFLIQKNCPHDTLWVPTGYHRKNWAFQICNCPPLWAIYIFTKPAGILRLVMLPAATLKWIVQVFTNSECSMTFLKINYPGVAHLPFWQIFQSNSWATSEF